MWGGKERRMESQETCSNTNKLLISNKVLQKLNKKNTHIPSRNLYDERICTQCTQSMPQKLLYQSIASRSRNLNFYTRIRSFVGAFVGCLYVKLLYSPNPNSSSTNYNYWYSYMASEFVCVRTAHMHEHFHWLFSASSQSNDVYLLSISVWLPFLLSPPPPYHHHHLCHHYSHHYITIIIIFKSYSICKTATHVIAVKVRTRRGRKQWKLAPKMYTSHAKNQRVNSISKGAINNEQIDNHIDMNESDLRWVCVCVCVQLPAVLRSYLVPVCVYHTQMPSYSNQFYCHY